MTKFIDGLLDFAFGMAIYFVVGFVLLVWMLEAQKRAARWIWRLEHPKSPHAPSAEVVGPYCALDARTLATERRQFTEEKERLRMERKV